MIETKKIITILIYFGLSITILSYFVQKLIYKIEESKNITDNQDILPFTVDAIKSNLTNTQAIKHCGKMGMRTANVNEINKYYVINKYKFSDESPAFTIGQDINLELNSYYPKEKKYDFNTKQDNYTLCINKDILQNLRN